MFDGDSLTSLGESRVHVLGGHADFPSCGLPRSHPPHFTSWLSLSLDGAFLEALVFPIYSCALPSEALATGPTILWPQDPVIRGLGLRALI